LHHHARRFRPPADFARPRYDWEGLFGDHSSYNPGDGAALFTSEQQVVFAATAERLRQVMAAIGQASTAFGLIHADFIPSNMLFQGDTVSAIDFDDCGWGYFLYDLAPAMWQFREDPRRRMLCDALWAGYTAINPLTVQDREIIEAFVAARHLASCRWIAGNRNHPRIRDRAAQIIADRTQELFHFLHTGRLFD
jgi:Ser/Thr protein kinase RdoA (MazF antagonist)